MRITSPRRLRAHRAAQRWAENGGDLRGAPVSVVEDGVANAADFLSRDLDLDEVDKTCTSAVAAFVHDREQSAASEAMAGGARR
jgi:hypothetical protein